MKPVRDLGDAQVAGSQNGVNGRLVTAPNGNSIFLPAAGHRVDTRLESVGSCGDYLSSSLCADSGFPYFAWGAYFDSSSVYVGYNYRRKGVSARAVYAE